MTFSRELSGNIFASLRKSPTNTTGPKYNLSWILIDPHFLSQYFLQTEISDSLALVNFNSIQLDLFFRVNNS